MQKLLLSFWFLPLLILIVFFGWAAYYWATVTEPFGFVLVFPVAIIATVSSLTLSLSIILYKRWGIAVAIPFFLIIFGLGVWIAFSS